MKARKQEMKIGTVCIAFIWFFVGIALYGFYANYIKNECIEVHIFQAKGDTLWEHFCIVFEKRIIWRSGSSLKRGEWGIRGNRRSGSPRRGRSSSARSRAARRWPPTSRRPPSRTSTSPPSPAPCRPHCSAATCSSGAPFGPKCFFFGPDQHCEIMLMFVCVCVCLD